MSEVKRAFKGKSVEMLTVSQTIAAHATAHKTELQAVVDGWDDPYFENLQGRLKTTMTEYFGIDGGRLLREATALVSGIQDTVKESLGLFKTVLEARFSKDKPFVASTLKSVGFTDFYVTSKNISQESLVQLLAQFKKNMTPELKAKLVAGGVKASLIESIAAKADELQNANVSQEVFKGNKKATTQEATLLFNEIYQEIIDLAKIAAKVFKKDKAVQAKFSYTENLRALTGAASSSTLAKKAKAEKALQTI